MCSSGLELCTSGSPCPKEAELAPSWHAVVGQDGKEEETATSEAAGSMLAGGREGKLEILANKFPKRLNGHRTYSNPLHSAV